MSNTLRITEQFKFFVRQAQETLEQMEASAIIMLYDGQADWARVRKLVGDSVSFIVAVDTEEQAEGAQEAGLKTIVLEMTGNPVYDRLMQALLVAITEDHNRRDVRRV